jgi:UMF1 family MFS transporter
MTVASVAQASSRRERWAWYLYDFGNSAYASAVFLAVYSVYFKERVVGGAEGTRLWSLALTLAMAVVALSAPILGTLADFSGSKKRFLLLFTAVCCLFTACLFFVEPGMVFAGVLFFVLAEIGYRSAQVFYDGLLPEIAAPAEMGRISGYGWAVGTVGGIVILLLIMPLESLLEGTLVPRLAMVVTAIFFVVFALPLFLGLRERAQRQQLPPGENYLALAFKRLGNTFRETRVFGEYLKFIIAFLVFNDGIIMVLDFAGIIGATLFGLDQQLLLYFFVLVQLTNVLGAYLFGILVDRIGGKPSLVIALSMMIAVLIGLYFNTSQQGFFILGAVAGLAMAGAQSVSRTMVAFFAPPGKGAEFYGFFATAGRTSSVIGPFVFGAVAAGAAAWLEEQGRSVADAEQAGLRLAILSIVAFIVVGMVLLAFVNERKASTAAATRVDG